MQLWLSVRRLRPLGLYHPHFACILYLSVLPETAFLSTHCHTPHPWLNKGRKKARIGMGSRGIINTDDV